MTARRRPIPAPSEPTADRGTGRRIGAAASGTVLVLVNLVTLLYTVMAHLMVPSGIGDRNYIEGAWFTGFLATVLAVITAGLTVVPVVAGWLRKRWFLVPVVLFVVATARWIYIDSAYPEADYEAATLALSVRR